MSDSSIEEGEDSDEEDFEEDPEVEPEDDMPVRSSRRPSALTKAGAADGDLVACSQLPFHNFDNESERSSFRQVVDNLTPGQALVTRLYRADDSFDAEVVFEIREIQDYRQGPAVAVDLIGASRDPSDIRVMVCDGEGESMLHLCRERGNCGRLEEESNLIHIREWKTCSLEQLDQSWITAEMRRRFRQKRSSFQTARGRSTCEPVPLPHPVEPAAADEALFGEDALPDYRTAMKKALKIADGADRGTSAPSCAQALGKPGKRSSGTTALERLRTKGLGLSQPSAHALEASRPFVTKLKAKLEAERRKLRAAAPTTTEQREPFASTDDIDEKKKLKSIRSRSGKRSLLENLASKRPHSEKTKARQMAREIIDLSDEDSAACRGGADSDGERQEKDRKCRRKKRKHGRRRKSSGTSESSKASSSSDSLFRKPEVGEMDWPASSNESLAATPADYCRSPCRPCTAP